MKNPNRGRVYRRCACRGADGRQLGARCPKLTNRKHGIWTYAVDLPTLDGKRRTRRRSGFPTKADAQVALSKVLEYERTGIVIDDRQTVADYLASWLRTKALTLKPTTMVQLPMANVLTPRALQQVVADDNRLRIERLGLVICGVDSGR